MQLLLEFNYVNRETKSHELENVEVALTKTLKVLGRVCVDVMLTVFRPNENGHGALPPITDSAHLAAWSQAIDFSIARGYLRRFQRHVNWPGIPASEKTRLRKVLASHDHQVIAVEIEKLWRTILAHVPYSKGLPLGFAIRVMETCALQPGILAMHPSAYQVFSNLYQDLDDVDYWYHRTTRVSVPRKLVIQVRPNEQSFTIHYRDELAAIVVDPVQTDFSLDFL